MFYNKKFRNLLENNNHLTVVSNAHNTIETLENEPQEAFMVDRTSPQFYMQRMGQMVIPSYGRGRYILDNYNTQENLSFPGQKKIFTTEQEPQESFIILPKKKKKNIIQIPNFFRIIPKVKKYNLKPEQNESLILTKKEKPILELKTENNFVIERKKRAENLIENINDIKLKADGKFFFNKPVLKKKNNLEVEYLVIKAPLKIEYTTKVLIPQKPKKTRYDDIQEENKFDIYYNMFKPKTFPLEETNISSITNFIIPHKIMKNPFKDIKIEAQSNFDFIKIKEEVDYNKLVVMDSLPYIYIPETPGRRYCSCGMEEVNIIGNLRPDACLEVDPEEEIFIPSVYDMLLIQNFWDNLEMSSFKICLRGFGYQHSNKNLDKENNNNKENINDNKDTSLKSEDIKENKKEDNSLNIDNIKPREPASRKESKKKKMSLKNILGIGNNS